MTRVAVVGMGVIGKRVVRAVLAHPELTLSGVVIRSAGTAAHAWPDLPYYASDPDGERRLRAAGLWPRGALADCLDGSDIVVDCGPSKTGATRYPAYRDAGVRAVFCGGERSPDLGPLVHSGLNPDAAASAPAIRLTSCNTTALGRLVAAVGPAAIRGFDAVVMRCCTDTDKAGKGVAGGVVIGATPSHHASDLGGVVPGFVARSAAVSVPMITGHVIHVRLEVDTGTDLDAALRTPRMLVRTSSEPLATAAVKDAYAFRRWNDRYELIVQRVASDATRHELWLSLDNEAITIPELLDAVTVATGVAAPEEAPRLTDKVLGIGHERAPREENGSRG